MESANIKRDFLESQPFLAMRGQNLANIICYHVVFDDVIYTFNSRGYRFFI